MDSIEERTKRDAEFLSNLPIVWTNKDYKKTCLEIVTLDYWREWYYSPVFNMWMHRKVDPQVIRDYLKEGNKNATTKG